MFDVFFITITPVFKHKLYFFLVLSFVRSISTLLFTVHNSYYVIWWYGFIYWIHDWDVMLEWFQYNDYYWSWWFIAHTSNDCTYFMKRVKIISVQYFVLCFSFIYALEFWQNIVHIRAISLYMRTLRIYTNINTFTDTDWWTYYRP